MRLMTSVWLALCVTVIGLTACSDGGGGGDAGTDGGTDTDTDADTDADAGPDGGTACVVYVNGTDGDDAASGASWAEGLATVEAGLDLAEPLGCDVWVKAGTYHPTHDFYGSNSPADPRTVTFGLRAGVALYGGFAGDETTLEQRDIVANGTILSGDLTLPEDAADAGAYVDDKTDNAYHVVIGADDATIDGFTITAGCADDGTLPHLAGGGMLNFAFSPMVARCTFSDNRAGYGGGMANYANSSPLVTGCTFAGNLGVQGGGMYNDSSSPTVIRSVFEGNEGPNYGGGMFNGAASSPVVTDCTFAGNTTNNIGGGMNNSTCTAVVNNCIFVDNSAGWGGGMSIGESSTTVTNCAFIGNSAFADGGGMYNFHYSFPTVNNSTFTENYTEGGDGGGVYNDQNTVATIANSVVWGNVAGGGSEIASGVASSATVIYSDIQGGYEGTGNIDADPLFVSAEGGDFRLQEGSPCIDTGFNDAVPDDVTTDLDGNPRIVDGDGDSTATVDMGAYEYQP